MRKRSHHQDHNYGQVLVVIFKNQILTCAGVVIVAVAGAGILGVAGVEAAEGCGLELGTGCVEEEGLTAVWTGARGAAFGAGFSARSTLFSWRAMLSEWAIQPS